jgi:murein DD-endopeptidase MepM/ murein hydrolase activator NlpD
MKRIFLAHFAFCAVLTGIVGGIPVRTLAAAPEELRAKIEEKNRALQELNAKIEETRRTLDATQDQGRTLAQDVKKLNGNISQLNLSIQSSELTINKLNLELESVTYDIADVKTTMQKNREAIAELLRKMQQKDNETVLALFLRNKSLADGVVEMQNFMNLNNNLSVQIENMKSLNTQLNRKLDEVSMKHEAIQEESQNLKSRKLIVLEEKQTKDMILKETKNKEALYQQQLAELEKQQESVSEEINEIEDELRKNFDPTLLPSKRPGVFMWPVKLASMGGSGHITQHYGEVTRYRGRLLYGGKPHNGLDIGVPIGTPVYAAEDGEVVGVSNNGRYQYGKYVMIKHENNLATLYAHLSRQIVNKGDAVRKGQIIGYSGNTGYSTGAHLHFGLYWAPSVFFKSIPPASGLVPIGVIIDPEDFL